MGFLKWFRRKYVKTPIIFQMDAAECGAVCLMIILAYHGRHITNADARKHCGISRDGSNAADIMSAARWYHCLSEAIMVDDLESLEEIIFPAVGYWKFEHFIVLEGIDLKKKIVYINDPAIGRYTMAFDAFSKGFTGFIVIITPENSFHKKGRPATHLMYFRNLLKRNRLSILFLIFTSTLVSLISIINPAYVKVFIDEILTKTTGSWPIIFLTSLIFTGIIWFTLFAIRNMVLLRMQTRFLNEAAVDFFHKLLKLPISFFAQRYTGDIANRLFSMDHIATFASGSSVLAIAELSTAICFSVILLLINLKLASICLAITFVNLIIVYYLGQHIWISSQRLISEKTHLYSLEINIFQSLEEIKCLGNEPHYFRKWLNLYTEASNVQTKIAMYGRFLWVLPNFLQSLILMISITLGSIFILKGEMTIGSLIAFQTIYFIVNHIFSIVLTAYESFQRLRADLARIQDVMLQQDDLRLSYGTIEDKIPSPETIDAISIKNVTFAYSELAEKPILDDISMTIERGSYTSIVGQNGAGKSTLIKLILGLYPPQEGLILINDFFLQSYTTTQLAKTIWYVDQDVCLFEGSVRDNLLFGKKNVPDEELHNALSIVFLDEELNKRGGLNCNLLENGRNLSGGQCQRLEIARALVYGADILIVDEATSALDYLNERIVIENLKAHDITIINISHRPEMFQYSDKIYVLEDGKISFEGKHEEALVFSKFYRHLIIEGQIDETFN